jgi:glycosyltransferase involved in cell wall biosynthesis
MKIALIIYGDLNLLTGGFLYDRLLVDHLKKRGEEVDIIALPWKSYRSGLLDNASFSPAALLKQKKYDLIVEDALAQSSLFRFNLEMKSKHGTPIVSIIHALYSNGVRRPWSRLLRKFEGFYFKSVKGLVFNSRTTQMDAESAAGIRLNGVVVYPGGDRLGSGMSEEEIVRRATAGGPLEIFFAGSLTRNKGLHILLDALERLSSTGLNGSCRLTVAGNEWMEPSYVRYIRDRIERSRLSYAVKLMGSLGPTEMANCFSRSHLLAVPSAYEGFGMAYIEGMAFGLPAIGPTEGGAGEIIHNGENGFLVRPGDDLSIFRHIGHLAKRQDVLVELSLNAKKSHLAHPSWGKSLEKVCSFFRTFSRD